jgi:CRP-like cAMP-binding protein
MRAYQRTEDHPVWDDVPPQERAALGLVFAIEKYPDGGQMRLAERAGVGLGLILSGRMRIEAIDDEGGLDRLVTINAGQIWGFAMRYLTAAVSVFERSLDVRASLSHGAVMATTPQFDVVQAIATSPTFAHNLLQLSIERGVTDVITLQRRVLPTLTRRMAQLLLAVGDEYSERDERGRVVVTGFTHGRLGDMIGTARESASRTLKAFRDLGYIEESGRHGIVLADEAGLRRIRDQDRPKS